MTEYTPETELVMNTYANDRVDEEDRNGNGDEYDIFMAQEEFDRWIQSVKAEVWEEAYAWGLAVEGSGGVDVENPYEEGTV